MKVVRPWRLLASVYEYVSRHRSSGAVERGDSLMLMPAALVGPTRLSAFCLRARPGESMDRTSMEVALAAKTYMKLDI